MQTNILRIYPNCNNNCLFCMIPREKKRSNFMSLSKIKEKLPKTNKKAFFHLFGGEPTLHPDFFEIIALITKQSHIFNLYTNSRIFTYEKYAKKLSESNIYLVLSSIHGPNADLHDSITQSKGSFRQTLKGLQNLIKYNVSVQVNIVVNSLNINLLKQTVITLSDIGIKNVKFSGLVFSGNMRDENNDVLIVSLKDEGYAIKQCLSILNKKKMDFQIEKLPICTLPSEADKFILENSTEGFTKFEDCNKCKFSKKCMGIAKGYLKRGYKFEPKPII